MITTIEICIASFLLFLIIQSVFLIFKLESVSVDIDMIWEYITTEAKVNSKQLEDKAWHEGYEAGYIAGKRDK